MSVLVPQQQGMTVPASSAGMAMPALGGSVGNIPAAQPMAQLPTTTAQMPMATGCAFPQPQNGAMNPPAMYAPGTVYGGQGAMAPTSLVVQPPSGMAAPPMQPQVLSSGMPDFAGAETQQVLGGQAMLPPAAFGTLPPSGVVGLPAQPQVLNPGMPDPASMETQKVYGGQGMLQSAGLGAPQTAGVVAPPMQPQRLTTGMPDPAAIETQKAAYHSSLNEQMGRAEEMLAKQQKEQTEYIYQVAEVQKKQMLNQIAQQAKEQELLLSQQYSQQLAGLQQQCARQKILLEKQASELSNSYHERRMQEELMEKEYQKQKMQYDVALKRNSNIQRGQRNEILQHRPEQWQYNPQVKIPIDVRAEPDIQGNRTEFMLQPGDLFMVSQEIESTQGIVYLKLADGRGWLFDKKPDGAVMCIRVSDSLMGTSAPSPMMSPMQTCPAPSPMMSPMQTCPAPSPMMSPMQPCPNQPSALDRSLRSLPPQAQPQNMSGSVQLPCPGVQVQAAPASVPVPMAAISQWIYSPEITALLDVRATPDINGQRTAHVMQPGEAFGVSEELEGRDGVLYLRLADGRGWVFDRKPDAGRMCVRHPAAPQAASLPTQMQLLQGASPPVQAPGMPAAHLAMAAGPSPRLPPRDAAPVGMQAVPVGPYPQAVVQPPMMARANSFDVVASAHSAVARASSFDAAAKSAMARVSSFDAVASSHSGLARMSSFQAAAAAASCGASSHWMYKPELFAPIDTRAVPEVEGPRLGHRLKPGDVFGVSEEKEVDGVIFLRLADGRGWLFDKKPGFGIMCVRHPAPAQQVAVNAGMSCAQSLPAGTTLQQPLAAAQQPVAAAPQPVAAGQQMINYITPGAQTCAHTGCQVATAAGSAAQPVMTQAGAPPMQPPAAAVQQGMVAVAPPGAGYPAMALPQTGPPTQPPAAAQQGMMACATAPSSYPAMTQQPAALASVLVPSAGTPMQPAMATAQQQSTMATGAAYPGLMQTSAALPSTPAPVAAATTVQTSIATAQQTALPTGAAYQGMVQTSAVGPAPLQTSAMTTNGQIPGGSPALPPTQYVGPACTQAPVTYPTGPMVRPPP